MKDVKLGLPDICLLSLKTNYPIYSFLGTIYHILWNLQDIEKNQQYKTSASKAGATWIHFFLYIYIYVYFLLWTVYHLVCSNEYLLFSVYCYCSLFVVYCLMLTINYVMLSDNCLLVTLYYLLFSIFYSLLTIYYVLLTVNCLHFPFAI